MIKRMVRSILPSPMVATLKACKILIGDLGQYRSMVSRECVDAKGSPIPWYTYPAIEFIKQLEFSCKTVFEYGSGQSTRFWAQRVQKLVAVEDDSRWYERIRQVVPGNVEYHLAQTKDEYVGAIRRYSCKFDVIIIDGSHRYDCAMAAVPYLSETGFIILDNSDWMEKTSEVLRNSDLIEVDMAGFGPINSYTWTTSFYFKRSVKLTATKGRQPVHGVGSLPQRESWPI